MENDVLVPFPLPMQIEFGEGSNLQQSDSPPGIESIFRHAIPIHQFWHSLVGGKRLEIRVDALVGSSSFCALDKHDSELLDA